MNYTIYFTIFSLFYSMMLLFVLKTRKMPNTNQVKAYKTLAIINFIGIIIEIIYYFIPLGVEKYVIFKTIFSRLFLFYLLSWITALVIYIYVISYDEINKKNNKKRFISIMIILLGVFTLAEILLPLYDNVEKIYSYGPSVDLIYYVVEAYICAALFLMFKNIKRVKVQKYTPLFAFIVGGSLIMLIQSSHPEYLLMTSMETFVTFMIYFTLDKSDEDAKLSHKEINKNGSKKVQK